MDRNEKTAQMRAVVLSEYERQCDAVAALCESPIEAALFWALLAHGSEWGQPLVEGCKDYGSFRIQTDVEDIVFAPQQKVKAGGRTCRLDFYAHVERCGMYGPSSDPPILAAIECDGHDFHERTKDQASRDRKRDRDLQAAGYIVLRFTGSDIYRDPKKVAKEIVDALNGKSRDLFEARMEVNAPRGEGTN